MKLDIGYQMTFPANNVLEHIHTCSDYQFALLYIMRCPFNAIEKSNRIK